MSSSSRTTSNSPSFASGTNTISGAASFSQQQQQQQKPHHQSQHSSSCGTTDDSSVAFDTIYSHQHQQQQHSQHQQHHHHQQISSSDFFSLSDQQQQYMTSQQQPTSKALQTIAILTTNQSRQRQQYLNGMQNDMSTVEKFSRFLYGGLLLIGSLVLFWVLVYGGISKILDWILHRAFGELVSEASILEATVEKTTTAAAAATSVTGDTTITTASVQYFTSEVLNRFMGISLESQHRIITHIRNFLWLEWHYSQLLVLQVPIVMWLLYLNWLSMKYFRHN